MEAPTPSESVALPAVTRYCYRPGPDVGVRDGVFQPVIAGMYDYNFELSIPDNPSCSSIPAPCSAEEQPKLVTNDISLMYQNVRGLRTKIDEIYLSTVDCLYDVIMFTETGLDDRINSIQLFGNSFNVFRCDRSHLNSDKRSFGGVLIAVAKQYSSALFEPVHGKHLEQVCVKATIHGSKFLLCALYLPPDKRNEVAIVDAHIASVRELCGSSSDNSTVIVCGDYNQPHIAWTAHSSVIQHNNSVQLSVASAALIDGMDFLNLCQVNIERNHLGRVLDLVFTTETDLLVERSVVPLTQPDLHHPPLLISLPATHHQVIAPECAASVRDSVDTMAARFCDVIRLWLYENLPFVKPASTPAWSTNLLRRLKRVRNKFQRKHRRWRTNQTKQDFKRASEDYRRLNASLYKSYVLRIQTDLRRNPKKFWTFVNSKRKCSSVPSDVYLDDTESSSESDSCELFASFFSSVFACDPGPTRATDCGASLVPADFVDIDVFAITPDMITAAAKKLKTSYCAGPDGIPAVVFCRCAEALAMPLCCIFNKSFAQGKFPKIWKHSFMFPVFKNGDRRSVRNYRGITNLPAASKLFEIIVGGALIQRTRHYISSDQHGFMAGRSVTTNLLDFTSNCIAVMERKLQVDVIYTDLKAAFDRINHRILLDKILRLGASQQFVTWLRSYLCDRVLQVKLGSKLSLPFTNISGVPQGIRPILENACIVWTPHQLYWTLRIERVQRKFIRLALRNLPWRDPNNLPPYPDRCRLLGLDTLECRRKIQQALFVAKLLNGEIDSPKLLSLMNFRAAERTLRPSSLLTNLFHRTEFGSNEPVTSCVRVFSCVEEHFQFGESLSKFKRLVRTNLL
ncbi:uncharacterized protein LOC128739423 [Sabethes cyaneus]|uniref:uncharacterized protein LOC128739423 n=1 Tax=Sabethes cyaneus TaxID=53552 RepID=UPI00237E1F9D|nr:uncharacterized protein LOC128739423 [Sabethes cyaneus]